MITTPKILSAYFFLKMADKMPAPVLGEDGKIDIEADNAALEVWSKKRTTLTFDNATLEKFINRTEQLLEEIEILKVDETQPLGPQYMTLFYDAGKEVFGEAQLRTYFSWLYFIIFQRDEGPRWGEFVNVCGAQEFVDHARKRFAELIL